ncbi:MAG: redoxin domain-containing protein [Planctomycetales bacterium]|nr:redoxin domain-containing protein [Planctomycetales bacterium]
MSRHNFFLPLLGYVALFLGDWLHASDFTSKLVNCKLTNSYGKQVTLEEYADRPILVLAFLGTECPLAKLYGPRLDEIQQRFQEQGVAVVGINSNNQDNLTELAQYVRRMAIRFPVLKDVGNILADAMGASRTPEVFVLDSHRDVRYHGRIDDQYGVGFTRERPERSDLVIALEELLRGDAVSVPETKALGCIIGRVKQTAASGEITFSKHIAPILNARCVSCHREGEIGPFTLTSYEDVLGWEDTILEVIDDRRMPPWNANPAFGHFQNDPRLTTEEIELLRSWVKNGMPPGSDDDLPPQPQFALGWRIPEPDQVFKMRDTAFRVPAEGVVEYKHFTVDPGWTEDKYICAAEARPDNRSVVHHILVYVVLPGQDKRKLDKILVGYAPGSVPVQFEEGTALHIPAGSKLLFQMHYTPNGTEQSDLSYAGVCFVDKDKVTRLAQGHAAVDSEFEIPGGADSFPVTARPFPIRRDEMLISMTPHMHLRGKSFRYEAEFPSGQREVLLDVPRYDFNWQLKYILSEPKLLPAGTKIHCSAVYDNSPNNPVNPDPTQSVRWGDQSWEEMMIGFFDTVPASPVE